MNRAEYEAAMPKMFLGTIHLGIHRKVLVAGEALTVARAGIAFANEMEDKLSQAAKEAIHDCFQIGVLSAMTKFGSVGETGINVEVVHDAFEGATVIAQTICTGVLPRDNGSAVVDFLHAEMTLLMSATPTAKQSDASSFHFENDASMAEMLALLGKMAQ